MKTTGPLTACLENAHDGELTVQDAVPMIQAAVWLMGDAAQNHAALRRNAVLQYLNAQVQPLMKESNFKGAQPYLLGDLENFAEKAKSKLETAINLCTLRLRRNRLFGEATLARTGVGRVAEPTITALEYQRRSHQPAAASQKRLQNV